MRVSVLFACSAAASNPINKVIQLLSSLEAKVNAEGGAEQQEYEEFARWCEENAKEKQHELKNSAERKDSLEAALEKTRADIANTKAKIEEISASISQNEADLEKATAVRNAEHKDFVKSDTDSAETIDTLERALQELKKEMAKGPVEVQPEAVNLLVGSITALLDAGAVKGQSKAELQAFVQAQESASDEFSVQQAPAAAAYEVHEGSANMLGVIGNLLDKAENQRSKESKAETEAQFNFEMLKQSLSDELKTENKELSNARQHLASYQETEASVTGDLSETNKDAAADSMTLRQLQTDCMQTASDHELSVQGRSDELKALAEAKRIIAETTGGATKKGYGLVQVSSSSRTRSTSVDLVVNRLKDLGRRSGDISLALLASQISTAQVSGDDVFAKVKGLIRDMMSKLAEKAQADAKEHEWCTTKTKETEAKKAEHETVVDKLTSKSDRARSAIAKAESQIATLEAELGSLTKMQAEMDRNRAAEHAAYEEASSDYTQGVEGVQAAIKVLKKYYGKESALLQQPVVGTHSASGAGGGIIGLLEVCESDFSKLLAEVEADEKEAEEVHKRQTKDNKQAKAEKETSLKYTQKTLARTEKALSELTDDTDAEQAELDATLEYLAKVNKRCVAKPETYEERKAKRESEIEGLKNALRVLEEETASSFLAVRSAVRQQ
jgi:chromosome segregation ATPase